MSAFVVLGLVIPYQAKRNIAEMTYFCIEWDVKP